MHSTLKKTLKRSVITLGSVIFGILLLLAATNAVDQEVRPEAIAFANLSDDEVPDQDNGYFIWVGFSAPADDKPHAVGIATVALINQQLVNQQLARHSLETIIDPASLLGPNALKFKGDVRGLCGRDSRQCLTRYQTKTTEIKKWLVEDRVLLERYRALSAYPQFRETILPRLLAPFFGESTARAASLARAQHALMALRGNPQAALQQLRDDTNYWRRILQQSRSLISRMIAVATIHSNNQLVSEIVATMPLDRHSLALASQASQPLTATERDLSKTFRHELGIATDVTSNIAQYKQEPCPLDSWADCISEKLMSTILFKPNATINLSYARLERLAQLARLSAHEWHERIQVRHKEHDLDNFPFVWHIFYNPVGKIMDAIAAPAYEGYSGRVHNLDGFLRLVSLQVEAKRSGIRDSAMQRFLTDSTPELRNPYTGEPMEWDTGARSIYFNGYDEKANDELLSKRIEVRL